MNVVIAKKMKTLIRKLLAKPKAAVVEDEEIINTFRQIRPLFPRFSRMMKKLTKISELNRDVHRQTYNKLIQEVIADKKKKKAAAADNQ